MEERHEIITFPRNMHIRVFMHAIGSVSRHWHRSLELLFLIKGSAHVTVDGSGFLMGEGDVTLINSNSIHELYSDSGATLIAVQIKPEMFSISTNDEDIEFDCVSATDPDKGRFDGLRMCVSRMLLENVRHSASSDYRNYGMGYWLLAELLEHFRAPGAGKTLDRKKYTQRLRAIIDYIEAHYAENFSLADLAAAQGLSVPYLSSFFAKYIGVKFSQYYTDVKLSHAMEQLTSTDDTVERVAADNGFTEPHTFIRAFKQKFGETPSVYRRQTQKRGPESNMAPGLNYLTLEPSNYLSILEKYTKGMGFATPQPTSSPTVSRGIPVNVLKEGVPLRHTFRQIITVGRAHDLLSHDIQSMLRDIQSTVGFKYIKFHGILADDMMVVSRSSDGSLQFRFQMIDSALDFLLSIGLKPLVQLSFMPTALASDRDKTIFYKPFNTSPPRDMGEWNLLIERLTRHLIARFGAAEVTSWPFTVWSEPDTPPDMFGFESQQDFIELFENTYRTVKAVCPDISFGTPGLLYMRHLGEPKWIEAFFRALKERNIDPDFISLHYYADILPAERTDLRVMHLPASRLPRNTDDFRDFITDAKSLFGSLGFGDKPLYLTEWNLTLSHRNLISDTCFKSCYIMKNLLENYDRLDSFGYWSLTDLLEENPLPESTNIFHGGLGIYTMSGVRKSVFFVFDFARRLGDELLARGDGYFVTRGHGGIQIITYNYVHYGDPFASGDALGVTDLDRYAPFDMSRRLTLSIPLTGLEPGEYILRERYVNRDHGSAFDIWVTSGGLPFSPEDAKLYAGSCVPALRSQKIPVPHGTYTYSPVLSPLEIRIATLTPADQP